MLLIHKELLLLFKIILEASFVGLFKTKHKKLFLVHFTRFLHYGYQRALSYFGNNVSGLSRGAKSLNVLNHTYSFDIIIRALIQV